MRNNITNNGIAISLTYTLDEVIIQNNIMHNGIGIELTWISWGHKIYHNNFIDNTDQVYIAPDSGASATWDDGYPSGGNYWSDHVCVGNPSDGSQPYIIDENNIDRYPFQHPNGWVRTVETTDESGEKRDVFDIPETVYIRGSGYSPLTVYDLYIVEDTTWSSGMDMPDRVSGTETSVTTDQSGDISAGTVAWNRPLIPGKYDVVIDVNGNGKYDEDMDALDDEDIELTAAFFVIPEYWLGTILGLIACFAAFAVFSRSIRKRSFSYR